MTNDEKIAQVVEMAFKADLDEEAKVIVNEAIRAATVINAELDEMWEVYNTMKTKYDYVMGLVAHLEELAKKYKKEVEEYRAKIENGTLVELPRIVRRVDMSCGYDDYLVQWEKDNGKIKSRIYNNEKSAKAKLRELKGERQ